MTDSRIYIKEVQGHQHRYQKLIQLTHSSTKAAGAMLLAAVVALIVANTAAHEPFLEFWHSHVGVFFGESIVEMSLAHVINDVFMAVFFLLVGLEVKYELTVGELTNIRQALLPIMAAVGGVLAPIAIYLVFNAADPQTVGGWGVPTATDIAFALGILALLGNRVPAGVRVFLSTLAVADDIIAILVIAIFYGQSPSPAWLLAAGVVLAVLVAMNRGHVYSLLPYMLVGALLWYCVYMSGVHSTIAGVLLAFAIPRDNNAIDHTRFLADLELLLKDYGSCDVSAIDVGQLLSDILNLTRQCKVTLPPSITSVSRGIVTLEGTVMPLIPNENMVSIINAHIQRTKDTKAELISAMQELALALRAAGSGTLDTAKYAGQALHMLTRGQVKVNMEVLGSEAPMRSLSIIINRLSLGIIVAGLFIGSSMVALSTMEPRVLGVPVLSFFGYLGALVLSIWVVTDILRKRR